MDPQGLHHVVLVLRILGIQTGSPLTHTRDDLGRVALAQLDLGQFASLVLGLLEQVQESGDGLALDLGGLHERTPLVGNAIDAPVLVAAVRVTQMVLHVTDDRLMPIGEVNRAIRARANANRAEVRIGGRNQILQRFTLQARAILGDLDPEHALEGNHVQVQEVALKLLGEVAAGQDTGARAGA